MSLNTTNHKLQLSDLHYLTPFIGHYLLMGTHKISDCADDAAASCPVPAGGLLTTHGLLTTRYIQSADDAAASWPVPAGGLLTTHGLMTTRYIQSADDAAASWPVPAGSLLTTHYAQSADDAEQTTQMSTTTQPPPSTQTHCLPPVPV